MIGYVGNVAGKIFKEKEFTLIKKVLESGERIEKHNHPGKTILITIVKGNIKVLLADEEERNLEPGKVLKFDGSDFIEIYANDKSEFFITIINKID